MRRTVLAIALLGVVVTAGCAGPAGDVPAEPTAETPTRIAEPAATLTETATAELPITQTTETLPNDDSEPEKGDQFLSVSESNESEAMEWNASERAAFEHLSADRQRIVSEAVACDCGVELEGEFSFENGDRIEVVAYDGTYYVLRVAIA